MIFLLTDRQNSSDLPSDLFEEGEVKPARKQKKKVTNGAAKKRPASEVCNLLHSRWIYAFGHENLCTQLGPENPLRTAMLT